MSHKSFAGIGSRATPFGHDQPYDMVMSLLSRKLVYEKRWVMTSGGADGADTFFQKGLDIDGFDAISEGLFKLFLPWSRFNGNTRGIVMEHDNSDIMHRARKILIDMNVYDTVPRFIEYEGKKRKELTRKELAIGTLHTRNVFQILNESLDKPVNMVVCYTKDKAISRAEYSKKTGGTGIAINLADAMGIPVFNLAREDHLERVCNFIGIDVPEMNPLPNKHHMQEQLF